MADIDVLGVSAHLDFNDIQKSINDLIRELDKIGAKTDVLSKRMNDAMNDIARSSDDMATKSKKAMEVLEQGVAEAKIALENYPQALHEAKKEAEATANATATLEKKLERLNAQLKDNPKKSNLEQSIAGIKQQIQSNNDLYERQITNIQQMEAGYNGLVSVLGAANVATSASAIAHGATASAVTVEAGAHTTNASAIEKENEQIKEGAKMTVEAAEAQKSIASRSKEAKEEVKGLVEEFQRLRDSGAPTSDVLMAHENALSRIDFYGLNREDYDLSLKKGTQAAEENAEAVKNISAAAEQAKQKVKETAQAEEELEQKAPKDLGFKQQWQAVNEIHDKIRELTRELQTYQEEYDKMSSKSGFDADSKKAQELLEKINSLKTQIADTKQEMSETSGVGAFFAKFKNGLTDAITGGGKFQQSLGDIKTALSGLIGPFASATAGAKAFTLSLLRMAATPLGAVITAIVLGLKAMHTWFTKSAEGQKAFAKITAFLSSLLSSLTDLVVKIGGYLYHAFADPQGALNQFGKGLIGMVVNPLKAVGNTLAGVGKIAKGVYDLIASGANVAEAKRAASEIAQGWENLKKAAGNVGDTLKSAWDTVAGGISGAFKVGSKGIGELWSADLTKIGSDWLKSARQMSDLAGREIELQHRMVELKNEEKQLDIEIAKEREKIYTLTGKEKDAQIAKVIAMYKEKYKPQIDAQQKLADIQKERNRLHTTSLEQIAKEREMQGAVYALQAQEASSTRMLVRMQQANLKSMANADKKDARKEQQIKDAETNYDEVVRKNSIAYAKAVQDMEQKIADARISAMEEGAEKYLSAKNRELEKELLQIDEQRKAAIEAERARQKAEFQAQEKIIKARGGKPEQWDDSKVDKASINSINNQYDKLRTLTIQRQVNEEAKIQIESMRNYLKEYGTFQQKKLAIAEEYAKKIEEAEARGNTGEALRLRAEQRKAEGNAKANELARGIDFSQMFEGVGTIVKAIAEETYNRVQEYKKTDEYKGSSPESKRAIAELESRLIERGGAGSSSPFSAETWDNITKAAEKYKASLKGLEFRTKEHNAALKRQKDAQEEYDRVMKDGNATLNQRLAAEEKKKNADKEVAETAEAQQNAQSDVDNAGQNVQNAANAAAKGLQDFNTVLGQITSGTLSGFVNGVSNVITLLTKKTSDDMEGLVGVIGQKAGGIIGAILTVIDMLGENPTEVIDGILDGVAKCVEEVVAHIPEIIASVVKGVGNIIGGVFGGIGRMLGIGGGADYSDYNKAKAKYDELSKVWDELISKKRQYLSESWGIEAEGAAQEALKLLQTEKEYNRILAQERLDSGSSTGSHSIWYRMWKGSYTSNGADNLGKLNNGRWASSAGDINWQDVNKAIEQGLRSEGLGSTSFRNMSDMLNMTGEQLEWIKANYTGLWAAMDSDFRDALENIIKFGETEKEILESLKEQILGTTLDSVHNNFMQGMNNLANGAKDVEKQMLEDWQTMVNKMVLDNVIATKYKTKLEKWYEKWYSAYSSDNNITAEELAALREEYNAIVQEASDEVKALKEQGLVKQVDGSDQQATYNSLEKWSYEQADDLINRATALQIIDENQYQVLSQSLEVAYSTLSGVEGIRASVQEIATAIAVTIELQEAANGKLDKIIANTNPIGEIRDLVKKLYNER